MNHADLSSRAMRRQGARTGAEAAPTSSEDTYNVILASRLIAAGGPPPAVPMEDVGPHSSVSGTWQRRYVRPAGLVTPSMEYIGTSIYVVRL